MPLTTSKETRIEELYRYIRTEEGENHYYSARYSARKKGAPYAIRVIGRGRKRVLSDNASENE
jgi:hypothetical protein